MQTTPNPLPEALARAPRLRTRRLPVTSTPPPRKSVSAFSSHPSGSMVDLDDIAIICLKVVDGGVGCSVKLLREHEDLVRQWVEAGGLEALKVDMLAHFPVQVET